MSSTKYDGSRIPMYDTTELPRHLIPEYTRQYSIKSQQYRMKNLLEEAVKAGMIREGRRQGNTTRMIDLAVQILFTDGAVEIDCHAMPERGKAFEKIHFAEQVQRRIKSEHPQWIADITDAGEAGGSIFLTLRGF